MQIAGRTKEGGPGTPGGAGGVGVGVAGRARGRRRVRGPGACGGRTAAGLRAAERLRPCARPCAAGARSRGRRGPPGGAGSRGGEQSGSGGWSRRAHTHTQREARPVRGPRWGRAGGGAAGRRRGPRARRCPASAAGGTVCGSRCLGLGSVAQGRRRRVRQGFHTPARTWSVLLDWVCCCWGVFLFSAKERG